MVVPTPVTSCCFQKEPNLLFHAWFGLWVLLQMDLLRQPVPNLVSVIHPFSCFLALCCLLGLQHHLSLAFTPQTHTDPMCVGTQCPCTVTHLGYVLGVGSSNDGSVLQDSVQGFPPLGCCFWSLWDGLEAPSLCCPRILKSWCGPG